MWWKIYSWIFAILIIIGTIALYSDVKTLNLVDGVFVAVTALTVFGTFVFAYSKKVLSFQFWKIFFWVSAIWLLLEILYYLTPLNTVSLPSFLLPSYKTTDTDAAGMIFSVLFSLPSLYAIYKLGNNKK